MIIGLKDVGSWKMNLKFSITFELIFEYDMYKCKIFMIYKKPNSITLRLFKIETIVSIINMVSS